MGETWYAGSRESKHGDDGIIKKETRRKKKLETKAGSAGHEVAIDDDSQAQQVRLGQRWAR